MLFENIPQFDPLSPALDPEQRPHTPNRYIPYVSLTQYIKPLHGSVEASYRFFQDSWGVTANTLALTCYKRYVMQGLDGVTSPTAYPSANAFTIGARVWF